MYSISCHRFQVVKKGINGMLQRMSIVNEMNQYYEMIAKFRSISVAKGTRRRGRTITAQTRQQIFELYETLYPNEKIAAQKTNAFNNK